jgi:RNA polymerase sigma factor (sigma-70 family)
MTRITATEMKLAERVGRRAAYKWKSVDQDDVISHLYLWIVNNESAVTRYRTDEGGEAKLFVTLRREATKFCVSEQQHQIGQPVRSENFYNVQMLDRALPFLFEDAPVTTAKENPQNGQTNVNGSPQDWGNAITILADIRGAFYGLNREIRSVLELRYRDGLTLEEIGELHGLSKVGVKKRIDRALERLCDSLAGERV